VKVLQRQHRLQASKHHSSAELAHSSQPLEAFALVASQFQLLYLVSRAGFKLTPFGAQ
jgi:hypothetical protein